MESYESAFINGQIALMENECEQLTLNGKPRFGLLALYENPFQHIRLHADFYCEHGVSSELLVRYLIALEQLEERIEDSLTAQTDRLKKSHVPVFASRGADFGRVPFDG